MKKILLAMVLVISWPAFAADKAPSEASIRELISITDAKKLLEGMYTQMDGMMEQAMKQALNGKPVTPEQDTIMAEYRGRVVDIMREEMSWTELEPIYVELYSKSFSQSEIDGMLKFYRSQAGRAVIAKLPVLTSNLMQMMMGRMQTIMPRIGKLAEEYVPKIRDAGN